MIAEWLLDPVGVVVVLLIIAVLILSDPRRGAAKSEPDWLFKKRGWRG